MNLDLFNNLLNSTKENGFIQNFIKELSNYLENPNKNSSMQDNKLLKENSNSLKENTGLLNTCKITSSLKQDGCLYQVVEMDADGAYLKNTKNNIISKEKDISEDIFNKIQNDSILKYKDGKYIYEEELTRKIF